MVERAKTLAFAPGCLVFPGGAVDRADDHPLYTRVFSGQMTDRIYRIAALREAYEEVGLFVRNRSLQVTLNQPFPRHVRRLGIRLDLNDLVPFAHWVTPIGPPRRFDTHFFLMRAPRDFVPKVDHGEVVKSHWIKPSVLLTDWEQGAAKLMFPTRLTLMKLARSNRVATALRMARAEPPVRVLPELMEKDGKLSVQIPEGAGFGPQQFDARDLIAEKADRGTEKA